MDTYKIKIHSLTPDAFLPYGEVIQPGQRVFPTIEPGQGRLAVELFCTKPAYDLNRLDTMAVHFAYDQTMAILRGALVLIVAPPPSNPEAPMEKYTLDYSRLAAFVMSPGDFVTFKRGTWHFFGPIGSECQFVLVGARTKPVEEGTRLPSKWGNVELVNLVERGDPPIEVQF